MLKRSELNYNMIKLNMEELQLLEKKRADAEYNLSVWKKMKDQANILIDKYAEENNTEQINYWMQQLENAKKWEIEDKIFLSIITMIKEEENNEYNKN